MKNTLSKNEKLKTQTILHGLDGLEDLLKGYRFLLVHGKSFDGLGISDIFKPFPHAEFVDFSPNPLYEQVVEGVKVFNENKCDMVVAVGGGSAIDVAKCIKLYCRMESSTDFLRQTPYDTEIPLVAIPTTAGTGSESTRHAVIYRDGVKQSISHLSIRPDIAVLEPSLLDTLPDYQRKCAMLDALCQAVESWWSVRSTDESVEYSRQAVELIRDNWRKYIFNKSREAAAAVMLAANYSGKAIDITTTTAPHAMSYKLSSLYRIPHGHAVALCMLPAWWYMRKTVESQKDEITVRLETIFNELPIDECWFEQLMDELEMQCPISKNREADIELLNASVNPERLANNPMPFDGNVLKQLYGMVIR
ncbi:MAG: phosphonoacetaldehyde reductase [Victivallales bacterium]|nr:phosphonoacetaldehyde reductase [Victivallales bacterium]